MLRYLVKTRCGIKTLERHTPLRSIKCRTEAGKSKFIMADIRKAIRKRNALKRKFNKTRKSQDWESYRVMRNRVVAMRRKSIAQHFDKLCNTRSSKPNKEFWNSVRPLMHTRKQDGNSYITLKENNKIIKEQHKVAAILNQHFTNATNDSTIGSYTAFEDQPHVMNIAQTNKLGSSHFSFRPINDVEVKSVIEAMKPNKAAGHDSIPPTAVKASVSTISQPLSVLINTIIHRSQVPETWKRGDISPIHKK